MDVYKIRITRQARDHLREIRRYISQELCAPDAAKKTIQLIKSEIQSLSHMPGRIQLTPEQPWHDLKVHRDRVKNYYIYYWIDEDSKTVQVISIIYVRRDQSKQLGQLNKK